MRQAQDLLIDYARYHRDPRNIATHLIGVPLIVLALGILLSHPIIPVAGKQAGIALTPAWTLWLASSLWYLSRGAGSQWLVTAATVAVNGGLFLGSHQVAVWAGADWWIWGIALFVVGWIIQFVGHYFEGRKPAFADDLVGLLVGPMFVVLELLCLLRLCQGLQAAIEAEAGPTRLRPLSRA